MCFKKSKRAAKIVLGLALTLIVMLQTTSYVQAGRWGGEVVVGIQPVAHVFNMHYVDENGNPIAEDLQVITISKSIEEMETYELGIKNISGYEYESFYYVNVNTGYTSPVMVGTIFDLTSIDPENNLHDSSIHERDVYVTYSISNL